MPGSGNRSATHPKPKGKTFAPRSHEVTEKAKDRWVCFGPQGFRSLEPGFRYLGTLSPSGRRGNRIKARILPVTREVWVFPWPHFSDTGTISKYRYSALAGTARIRRAEEEPVYFCCSPCLRDSVVQRSCLFGFESCGPPRVCGTIPAVIIYGTFPT